MYQHSPWNCKLQKTPTPLWEQLWVLLASSTETSGIHTWHFTPHRGTIVVFYLLPESNFHSKLKSKQKPEVRFVDLASCWKSPIYMRSSLSLWWYQSTPCKSVFSEGITVAWKHCLFLLKHARQPGNFPPDLHFVYTTVSLQCRPQTFYS